MSLLQKFARLDDYPVFFTINTLAAVIECAKTNAFGQPTGYIPIICLIVFFPFLIRYIVNSNIGFNFLKKPEYYMIIGIVWFCCFFFQKMWIIRVCLTYKSIYYFIIGVSLGKTITNQYNMIMAHMQDSLISILLSTIGGCFREIILYVLCISVGGNARNPIPVAIASLIIISIYHLAKKSSGYRSYIPVAICCALFGLFFAYRANVSDQTLMLF